MRKSIGEFLAALRKAHGYTQLEVAEKLDVSNKTVSAWERGTVLPDILLLPALAELYGVTADEILAGERKNEDRAEEPKKFSEKSETKLLKRKISKFTMQAYILGGVFLAGAVLVYVGFFKELTTKMWTGWQWWLLLLYFGITILIVSFAVLLALFRGSLSSADEETENYPQFCLLLFHKVSLFGYFSAGTAFLCALVTVPFFTAGTSYSEELSFLLFLCLLIALALFLFAFFMDGLAQKRWGGEGVAVRRKKNGKLYVKTALFGLIPAALALALIISLSVVDFTTRDLLYSADRETFRKFMETLSLDGRDYPLPLSDLEKGLDAEIEYGKEYVYDKNISYCISYCFSRDGFCDVRIEEGGIDRIICAERLTAKDGFSVYNLHEGIMGGVMIGGNTVKTMYYEIRTENDTAFYERVFIENYGSLGRGVGAVLLIADILGCLIFCAVRREKTVAKL